MKKRFSFPLIFLVGIVASLLLPTHAHAQNNNYFIEEHAHAKPSKKDTNVLLKQIQTENRSVDSVTQNVGLYVVTASGEEENYFSQAATIELLFGNNQTIQGAYLYSEYDENDQFRYEETFLPSNKKAVWTRSSENEDWVDLLKDSLEQEDYYANPNYHLLFETIMGMADKLKFYEDETSYLLFNDNQTLNLFDKFQPHYSLSISGLDSDDLITDILVTFDKETLLLQEFNLLSYYEGDEGYVEFNVLSYMDRWNEFSNEDFFMESEDDLENLDELTI
ncbi:hypothetical protein ACQV2X_08505 [Facklamia sp. P12945]|uniref:hypothetical protein n=1 Tax=unclassified Facklamia TaxID=2622293 RepID=UPI003D171749